jgi:hypothetical protein
VLCLEGLTVSTLSSGVRFKVYFLTWYKPSSGHGADDGCGGMGVKHDQLSLNTLQQVGLHEIVLFESLAGRLHVSDLGSL